MTFVDENIFCTVFPVTIPLVLSHVRKIIIAMATTIVVFIFSGPRLKRTLDSEIHGNNTPVNFAKATATAAIEPH